MMESTEIKRSYKLNDVVHSLQFVPSTPRYYSFVLVVALQFAHQKVAKLAL